MTKSLSRHAYLWIPALLAVSLSLAACGSSEPSSAPPTETTDEPAAVGTAAADAGPVFNDSRAIGEVDGVTFLVTEGSEATFTVGEQLARLPLPNDAVLRTTALSGEVFLDGRPSSVSVDIHRLSSDQSLRDRWVRSRMFPQDPIATFTLDDATPFPEGFTKGEDTKHIVAGQLSIRGLLVPMEFEIEARDDGDVVFILGRTTFLWSDIGMTAPSNRATISVEDEVRVEILLTVKPLLNP